MLYTHLNNQTEYNAIGTASKYEWYVMQDVCIATGARWTLQVLLEMT